MLLNIALDNLYNTNVFVCLSYNDIAIAVPCSTIRGIATEHLVQSTP